VFLQFRSVLRAANTENGHACVLFKRTVRGTAALGKISTSHRGSRRLDEAPASPIRFLEACCFSSEIIRWQRTCAACCVHAGLRSSSPSVISLILRLTLKFRCFLYRFPLHPRVPAHREQSFDRPIDTIEAVVKSGVVRARISGLRVWLAVRVINNPNKGPIELSVLSVCSVTRACVF